MVRPNSWANGLCMAFKWGVIVTTYKSWDDPPSRRSSSPNREISPSYKILQAWSKVSTLTCWVETSFWRRGLLWVWWFSPRLHDLSLSCKKLKEKAPQGSGMCRHADMPTWGERRENSKFFVFCLYAIGGEVQQFKNKVSFSTSNSWVVVHFFFKILTPRLGNDPFSQIFSDGLKPPTSFLWKKNGHFKEHMAAWHTIHPSSASPRHGLKVVCRLRWMWFLNIVGGCTHLQICYTIVFQQSLFIDIFVKRSKSSLFFFPPKRCRRFAPLRCRNLLGPWVMGRCQKKGHLGILQKCQIRGLNLWELSRQLSQKNEEKWSLLSFLDDWWNKQTLLTFWIMLIHWPKNGGPNIVEAVPFFHVFFTKSPNPWPSEDMVVPATRLEWRHWSSQPLCTLRCRESPLGASASGFLRLLGGWGSSQDWRTTWDPPHPKEDENGLETWEYGEGPPWKRKRIWSKASWLQVLCQSSGVQ